MTATKVDRVRYTASAEATGGREGRVRSSDGVLDLGLVKPPGMGGPRNGASGTNPEQLFAAGYAACFHGALLFHAKAKGLDLAHRSSVGAAVGIGLSHQAEGLWLTVTLTVNLPEEVSAADGRDLLAAADMTCPYSRAVRGNIEVRIQRADEQMEDQ
ncbi:Ohr family peroxiredoxin [Streptomyces canus]|uniref:Ohr family peroxiredoxin n=1 Tax=Streptomyces canus TaxID=58343 RepID=UPI00035C6E79|nr:Ohr family peroxiredoxin [Streptomyces canus]